MASIIWENYVRGRKTSLWFSVSPDLEVFARNDLEEIGGSIPLQVVKKAGAWEADGILFCSYSSLNNCLHKIVDFLGAEFCGVVGFTQIVNTRYLIDKFYICDAITR